VDFKKKSASRKKNQEWLYSGGRAIDFKMKSERLDRRKLRLTSKRSQRAYPEGIEADFKKKSRGRKISDAQAKDGLSKNRNFGRG